MIFCVRYIIYKNNLDTKIVLNGRFEIYCA